MPCNRCFDRLFKDARIAALCIASGSLALLAGAYIFQYVAGLQPCILCLYQRVPHAVAAALGLIALGLAFRRNGTKPAAALLLLCALVYVASTALAFYHVGVEQHWWRSAFEACAVPGLSLTGDNLLAQLESTAAVRCDAVAWQMFGISMAGYNAILSFGLAVYAGLAALLVTRRANGF